MPVTVRPASTQDIAGMLAIYAPIVRETATSFEEAVPSEPEFAQRLRDTTHYGPWLVCDIDGAVAGYAYSTRFRGRAAYRWSTEVAVYVSASFRRRGIARALYDALIGVIRLQGRTRVVAGIALPNPDSVAFHEAYGFAPVGTFDDIGHKFGNWHAVGFWVLPLADPESPTEPIPPDVALATSEAAALFATAAAAVRT